MAAAPTFRRGEIIAKRFQVVTKSGETAMWVGYHACDQANHSNSGEKGNIPEPDVLVKIVKPDLLPEPAMRAQLVRDLQRLIDERVRQRAARELLWLLRARGRDCR